MIAATSEDRLRVWRDGTLVIDAGVAGTRRMWLRADGAYLAVYAAGGAVFDTRSGARVLDLPAASDFIIPVHDHVFAAIDGQLHVIPLVAGAGADASTARELSFEPVLATELADGSVMIGSLSGALAWFTATGAHRADMTLGGDTLSLVGSADGVLAGGADGTLRRWSSADNDRHDLAFGHDRWIHGAQSDGAWIASWSRGAGEVRLWRTTDGGSGAVMTREWVLGAAFDRGGHHLLVVDQGGTARIVPVDRVGIVAPARLAAYIDDRKR